MTPILALLDAVTTRPAGGIDLRYGSLALGVFLMSIGLIRWSLRTYLEANGITPVKGLKAPKMSPQFRVLQEMGLATGEQLATMGSTEREMLFVQAMARRANGGAPSAPQPTPASDTNPLVAAVVTAVQGASFRVSCSPDYLFCPACGVTIGDRRTPLGFITSCLTCKRVLKAKLEGERVTIEAAGG